MNKILKAFLFYGISDSYNQGDSKVIPFTYSVFL